MVAEVVATMKKVVAIAEVAIKNEKNRGGWNRKIPAFFLNFGRQIEEYGRKFNRKNISIDLIW